MTIKPQASLMPKVESTAIGLPSPMKKALATGRRKRRIPRAIAAQLPKQ